MTITILCAGGLGNQLFQYAAARTVCDRLGVTVLKVDTRFYPAESRDTPHGFWLDRFPIRGRVVAYPRSGPLAAQTYTRRVSRRLFETPFNRRFKESMYGYNPAISACRDGTIISGLFQSYLYFWDNISGILEDFDVSPSLSDYYNTAAITAPSTVSIHVRRGDYSNQNNFLMTDPVGYYRNAMSEMRRISGVTRFRVFSDDIGWCRTSDIFPNDVEYFDPPEPKSPVEDLVVMSRSAHHIIANSTYSWWGAALGSHAGKRVIAPREWLRGFSADELEIIPPEWIQI